MPLSDAEFAASYDWTTKIISAAVCALVLGVSFVVPHVLIGIILLLMVVAVYAYSPRGYTVSQRTIIVRRLIGNVRYPLEGVREARRTTADDVAGCIKVAGSGGMFGYYGLFRTSKLGKCRWYVTNRRNTVVVIADAGTALFSPDDVDGFLAAIRASAPVSPGPPDGLSSAIESHGWSLHWPAKWIAIGVAVVAFTAGAFAVLYSPGPPDYTLTPDTLTIHDRFYPVALKAADVDVSHIRVIDIATGTGWRPTVRTNGFANSHYRSGWFRVANGRKVRMYRADGTRLVLLPPKGDGVPVLLEVKEPERFVQEVRREWASPSRAASVQLM